MSEKLKEMKRQNFEDSGTHMSLNVADGGALVDGYLSDAHVETTRRDDEDYPYVYVKIDGKSSKNPRRSPSHRRHHLPLHQGTIQNRIGI